MVQRGRASALTAVGPGSVSDWGTKIPQAMHGRKKKKCFGVFCGFQICIQAHSDGHHAPPNSLLALSRNLAVL